MAILRRWMPFGLLLFAAAPRLEAATAAETRAFNAASELFRAAFYDQAEEAFGKFSQKFPNSTRLGEAILLQAEARIELTNYAGAIDLLAARQGAAGPLTDQYLFWLGEARSRQGDYAGAREAFGRLLEDFPGSSRRLEASIGQATAGSKLADWPRVAAWLQDTNGAFLAAARNQPTNQLVLRGYLLLGETRLAQADFDAAEAALQPLATNTVSLELAWERQYLLCRILLASGQPEAALQNTTNLLAAAVATSQRALQADSAVFQAALCEQMGRVDDAIAAYQQNLPEDFPANRQRQALLKITELCLAQNRVDDAARRIEQFLDRFPTAAAADLGLLTLGELRLRQNEFGLETNFTTIVSTNVPAGTNCLQQARAAFEMLTARFPQSPLLGKAQLDLGWCCVREGNLPASQAAFQAAVHNLPPSVDQATAYFKLADAQLQQTNFDGAITNFSALLAQFASLPEVETNLFEPALYQIVRAGLAGNALAAATNGSDLAAKYLATATNALDRLLAKYPDGFHTERAVLLTGQVVGRRDPAQARALFEEFARRAPDASLMPQLQLAIARTYEQQNQWEQAMVQYDRWLTTFTNHPAAPNAEYHRALACFQAGHETNAFSYFTNFLAHSPTNEFAPLAQWWVADYYFRQGGPGLLEAEKDFQAIYQNTNLPPCRLTYEAVMMAGRTAVARQSWDDAKDYFIKLANNTNCPADLRAQALFAYGDYWMSRDSTNKLADCQQAINAYDASSKMDPSSRRAALAWGAKASCALQWAEYSQEPESLTNALDLFQQVISATNADVAARSIAKVGLGSTLEKLARQKSEAEQLVLRRQALDNYLDVFFDRGLLRDGETPDPFWTKKAGLQAARLAESNQQWLQAARVYQRLQELFPALRASFQKSIDKCEEQSRTSAD